MELFRNNEKRAGFIGSLLLNAAILISFIFLGFTSITPTRYIDLDMGNGGILLNDLQSGGNNNTEIVEQIMPIGATRSEESFADKNQLVQQEQTVPTIESNSLTKDQVDSEEENRTKKRMNDLLFSQAFNSNNPGTTTTAPGNDTGNEGNNQLNGKSPKGLIIELGSRKIIGIPALNESSQEQGKVVVKIIVDRNGNVLKATGGEKGTTATSSLLIKEAEKAALKAKFETEDDGPELQAGTITFTFKLQ